MELNTRFSVGELIWVPARVKQISVSGDSVNKNAVEYHIEVHEDQNRHMNLVFEEKYLLNQITLAINEYKREKGDKGDTV